MQLFKICAFSWTDLDACATCVSRPTTAHWAQVGGTYHAVSSLCTFHDYTRGDSRHAVREFGHGMRAFCCDSVFD